MINHAYIEELQSKKIVPDFLTLTQQEHVSVEYIYIALMAKRLSFEDIEFLPKLSQGSRQVLDNLTMNDNSQFDGISARSNRYNNFFSVVYYANLAMTADEIYWQEKKSDSFKLKCFVYAGSIHLLLINIAALVFFYKNDHSSNQSSKSKDKPSIQNGMGWDDLYTMITILESLYVLSVCFPYYFIINPIRRMQELIQGHKFNVLSPKSADVQIDYQQELLHEHQIVESSCLETLKKRGVVTDLFLSNFEFTKTQWTNLNHPVTQSMLLSNNHIVKLSHFLKNVDKLTPHQALVLSHPLVYRGLADRMPYNFFSVNRNFKRLLEQAKKKTAWEITQNRKFRRVFVWGGYFILSFLANIVIQSKTNLPRSMSLILSTASLLPFALGVLVSCLTKLGSYFLPGNGLFKKRTVIQECVFTQHGKDKPEMIDLKTKKNDYIALGHLATHEDSLLEHHKKEEGFTQIEMTERLTAKFQV